jgi:hypothetical protein
MVSEPVDLDQLRAAAVADAKRSMAANAELTTVMEGTMRVAAELVDAMERGEPLIGTMRSHEAADARIAATTAIRTYESARHRSRLRLIAVAIAEGATDADLCDLWKMSSEMVRRAKREIAELGPTGMSPAT